MFNAEDKPGANKKMRKQDLKEDTQKLAQELEDKGLSYNDVFQKTHAHSKILCRKGHWSAFLEKIASDKPLECDACQKLYNKFVLDIVDEPVQAEEEEEDPNPEDLQPRKRGRPKKGEVVDETFLIKYIQSKRLGIYELTKTSESDFVFFCIPCQRKIPFFRNALTYLNKHELHCQSHRKGLQLLNLNIEGNSLEDKKPCQGLCVNELSSDTCGKTSELVESLKIWFAAGMPFVLTTTASNKGCCLEQCSWRMEGDQFVCRHSKCVGIPVTGACHVCKSIVQSPKMASEIGRWAYKIDLGTLAHNCAYASEAERQNHISQMMNRDYRRLELAGSDLEEILKMLPRQIVMHVRKAWESVARFRRSGSYDGYVKMHIQGLAEYGLHGNSMNKDVFATLVQNFRSAMEEGTAVEDVSRHHLFR